MLEHRDTIADSDAERAAGTALADHDADDRRVQPAHLEQIPRNRLGLAPLLGADARVGAFRVDQRHDRKAELLGEAHLRKRLAVALRMGAAEVAADLLRGGAPAAMPDHEHLVRADAAETGHDRRVVRERPIAVQLDEVAAHEIDQVGALRPHRMPRDLHGLPGRERLVGLDEEAVARLPKLADLASERSCVGTSLDRGDLPLDLENGRFEVELVGDA